MKSLEVLHLVEVWYGRVHYFIEHILIFSVSTSPWMIYVWILSVFSAFEYLHRDSFCQLGALETKPNQSTHLHDLLSTWNNDTVYKLVSITLRKITGTESILKTMLTLHHHYLSTRKRTAFPLRSNRENRSLYYILDPYMQVRNSLSLTFFSVTWCKMALSLPAS